MNPLLMICYNNLELTKQAVDSALLQDVEGGVELVVVNNGSTDGTHQWLSDLAVMIENITVVHLPVNQPVVKVANEMAAKLFENSSYILGMPNDVILHPSTYREMLKWPRGLVTASEIRDRGQYEEHIKNLPATQAISENTPMAVMLARKWAYDALMVKDGFFFDEHFTHYASDCDMALRISACGIRGIQLSCPYWHYGSASVRLTDPFTMQRIRSAADGDRAYFVRKYGFAVDSLEYGQKPADINFRG